MTTAILENWSVVEDGNPYMAPECRSVYVHGDIFGDIHSRWKDGHSITTSRIKAVSGRYVTTNSGSSYLLGKIDPDYFQYCKKFGGHVPTEEVPIKYKDE